MITNDPFAPKSSSSTSFQIRIQVIRSTMYTYMYRIRALCLSGQSTLSGDFDDFEYKENA